MRIVSILLPHFTHKREKKKRKKSPEKGEVGKPQRDLCSSAIVLNMQECRAQRLVLSLFCHPDAGEQTPASGTRKVIREMQEMWNGIILEVLSKEESQRCL